MEISVLRGASVLGTALLLLVVACSEDQTLITGAPAADGGTPEEAGPVEPDAGPVARTPDCRPNDVKKGYVGSQTITVGGAKRTYELFVPETYDNKKAFPIVFVFHGDGGTGKGIRSSFALEKESAGGAIFVYPDGENNTWIIDNGPGLLRDVAFVDAVAADLGKTHCTDAKRIFSVGFSKGAYFTNMLGCVSKAPMRAVVAHSGGGPFYLDGIGAKYDNKTSDVVCPASPMASLQIIGQSDSLLDDAKKARDHWERVNACKSTSKPFDPSPCIAYDGCAADRPEIYCEIPGLGHQVWQSASKVTWSFLKTK